MIWFLMLANVITQTVTVTDVPPTAVTLSVAEETVHLTANAIQHLAFYGTASDPNGCDQLMASVDGQIKAYRAGVAGSFDCAPDQHNCYAVDLTQFTFSGCDQPGDTTVDYQGYVDLSYYADATDVSSSYSADAWILAGNLFGLPVSDEFEIASLIAVDHDSTIDYGRVPLGTDSAVQTMTFTSTGNRTVNIAQTSLGDFICDGSGSDAIQLTQLKYHLTKPDFAWDDSTAQTVTQSALLEINLLSQTAQTIYYRLRVPTGNYSGQCNNTLTFTAVAI